MTHFVGVVVWHALLVGGGGKYDYTYSLYDKTTKYLIGALFWAFQGVDTLPLRWFGVGVDHTVPYVYDVLKLSGMVMWMWTTVLPAPESVR